MPQNPKNEPLCDVFATQGILVVSVCILAAVLHLLAPAYCAELLGRLHDFAENSPDIAEIAAGITEWFASVCSV